MFLYTFSQIISIANVQVTILKTLEYVYVVHSCPHLTGRSPDASKNKFSILLNQRYVNPSSVSLIFRIFYLAGEFCQVILAVNPVIIDGVAVGGEDPFSVPVAKCQGGDP